VAVKKKKQGKSVTTGEIADFLNELLAVADVPDKYTHNGLQVCAGRERPVTKVGFAVDACRETFQMAAAEKCDLLVVHHGLFWPSIQAVDGAVYARLKLLFESGTALYAVHLPLDAHLQYGNNAVIAARLGLSQVKSLGFGVLGEVTGAGQPLEKIKQKLEQALGTACVAKLFSSQMVKKIYIVSGGGSSEFNRIKERGDVQLFITGEMSHSLYHAAQEAEINLLFAGHYATETTGVQALMPVVAKKFGVQTVFLSAPTGL
jgi:dinuclear metal center YbgI/SA1388 family protein